MSSRSIGSSVNTWIFQANPTRYDIYTSLRLESEENWNLNQHAKKIKAGDRALIWLCGDTAGIYAVGTIVTNPELKPDSETGQGYWTDKREGKRVKSRVSVRYERILLDNPLLKAYLLCDPALWNLKIIKNARGTNFSVTHDEWLAIKEWLDIKLQI